MDAVIQYESKWSPAISNSYRPTADLHATKQILEISIRVCTTKLGSF